MPTMTPETFEQMLQKQRPSKDIVKWRDFAKEETIHTIVGKKILKTKNGDALVIILEDNVKVWACSSLAKRLEENKDKSFPCYVRSKGKVQSKQNKSYQYYGFDLVWDDSGKERNDSGEKKSDSGDNVSIESE